VTASAPDWFNYH